MRLSGTVFQLRADLIKSAAFNKPNPNFELTLNPAPFVFQPAFPERDSYCEVHVTKCCMSRHVKFGLDYLIDKKRLCRNFSLKIILKTYLASKTKAKIPAAKGAAADVPVWPSVHLLCMSAVTIF